MARDAYFYLADRYDYDYDVRGAPTMYLSRAARHRYVGLGVCLAI